MWRDRPHGVARAALLLISALALVTFSGCGRLDKDSVSTELKTLQSATGEGYLVAREAARDRAPADFIEIRTAELSKQARDVGETLSETQTESGLQRAAGRGIEISNRASEILDKLHEDPSNSNLATNVGNELLALHDDAGKVGDSL
jgi:hypothetical protein